MLRKKDQIRSKYQAHPLVAILGKALLICSGNINVSICSNYRVVSITKESVKTVEIEAPEVPF